MEGLVMDFWANKRVLLTGHTGFKGSWLSLWLHHLGASVTGLSNEPEVEPTLFSQLGLENCVEDHIGDVRHAQNLADLVAQTQPDVVFHLAAQPLVRRSYQEPLYTWETNVLGTVHLLEALRQLRKPCAAVFITTDKVYENREWNYGYRESDPLGGYDPYSSSKAAAEIAISAWRQSFFPLDNPVAVAVARAGNVIGGGDWSEDRVVPDAIRALQVNHPIQVRNPGSTRPWQHVLEPLSGYLLLAQKLYDAIDAGAQNPYATAFNFGPALSSNQTVKRLVEQILECWPGQWQDTSDPLALHEAGKLHLITDQAFHLLGWQPRWNFHQTVAQTVGWYRSVHEGASVKELTMAQILAYEEALTSNANSPIGKMLETVAG
jgi:CDP-glucose 4,6-dehydratase